MTKAKLGLKKESDIWDKYNWYYNDGYAQGKKDQAKIDAKRTLYYDELVSREAYAKQKQIELLEKVIKEIGEIHVVWKPSKASIEISNWLEQELKKASE